MFLSRLDINPIKREARKLLGSPQAMHAAVMGAAAAGRQNDAGRVLWRLDEVGQQPVLYVVSPTRPSFDRLKADAGWDEQEPRVADYDSLLERIQPGQQYVFRLTANPTHVVTEDGKKKRFGHVTERHQREWFKDRTTLHGFRLTTTWTDAPVGDGVDLVLSDRRVRTFRRAGRPVTLTFTTFTGGLEVTDAGALRRALTTGIGRAKAYGCGLLTLARPA